MRARGFGQRSAWLLLPALALVLDYLSKAWILARFLPGEVHPVIPGFFNLTLGMNPGAVFGLASRCDRALRGDRLERQRRADGQALSSTR